MYAYSFHHIVEQRLKKEGNVFDFNAFTRIMNFKCETLDLLPTDFIYPRGITTGKYASEKPKLENIRVAQFRKDDEEMFWKESFEEKFRSAVFLLKTISREVLKGNILFLNEEPKQEVQHLSKRRILSITCAH